MLPLSLLKHLSIRQLLLLAFLLAGLLPAMLVSFLSFYQARHALKKEITHDLQTLSQTVANNIERMLFERMQNVQSWSQLAVMQELKIGDVDKRLATFLQDEKVGYGEMYHEIYVINLQGEVVASSNNNQIGQTKLASKNWFNVNLGNKTLSLAPIAQNNLAISQVILDENANQAIGQLVAVFNWKIVQDLFNHAVQGSAAGALFSNGRIIAATPNWQKIEQAHGMHASANLSGQFNLQNWQVKIEKLHSVAIAPINRLAYVFLALLASTLLLAALLVTPIAQAITQPLGKLTRFVRGFTQNQQSVAPKSGPPEVQELSVAFEKMMADLSKTQANLTRAAKLAVVGEMAAAMSHEVRTPLGILRSSADLLLREPKLTDEGREVLGFVVSETERLSNLVSRLIDSARPRALNFTTVDMDTLIKKCVAMLQPQAQVKQILIENLTQQSVQIQCDADQMMQVLMNLMMNAIQVLPNAGSIQVKSFCDAKNAIISVADNGQGISVENQAQIFEPFFTQRAGGVGLGLAVVRQVVHAHQGDILYSTSPLGGAQFTITLPMHAQQPEQILI